MTVVRRLGDAESRALSVLSGAGRDGLSASIVGAVAWPHRTGRRFSANGGGDYAAQMLLGRLRRRGFVAVVRGGEGSSMWELTAAGRVAVVDRPIAPVPTVE